MEIAYIWKMATGYTKYTYKRNIDKLCHNEVCSFDGSEDHALEIFLRSLKSRRDKAKKQHDKFYSAIKKIHTQYIKSAT